MEGALDQPGWFSLPLPWLNIDMGEMEGEDTSLYGLAHSVNIACGGHAGTDATMDRAIAHCKELGTLVGAHPSYPDRDGFGRRPWPMTPEALRATVAEQCRRLATKCAAAKIPMHFLKAHGALYHNSGRDPVQAEALLDGALTVLGPEFIVLGPREGALRDLCAHRGIRYAVEGFADRGLDREGRILPRGAPGAVLQRPDEAARQAQALVSQKSVQTLCVHGDTPSAAAIARAVRDILDQVRAHP